MSSLEPDADPTKAVYWRCHWPGCPTPALEGLWYCDAHLDHADALDRKLGVARPQRQREGGRFPGRPSSQLDRQGGMTP